MYNITQIVDGIKYTVYFFGSFSGMTHPFTPTHPIEFDAIHGSIEKYSQAVYYQGWYSDAEKGPRLDRFLKYSLLSNSMKLSCKVSNKSGVYYHRLEKVNGDWVVKELISPNTVFKQEHYLRYVVSDKGELITADHIYSSAMDSYLYTYDDHGVLTNVDTKVYDLPEEIPDL